MPLDTDTPISLVNGRETDRIFIADRGLAYGDGLFETVAVRGGCPCLWVQHQRRLQDGARRLGIPFPPRDLLWAEGARVIGSAESCVLKIILTRGEGGRGYRPCSDNPPTRILIRFPEPDYPSVWREEGVTATLCKTPLGENPCLAGLKHLNRLEQVLARAEWDDPRIAEGIMFDGRGRVIGGSMTNLFLLNADRLLTPRLDSCGIAGTVRGLVMRLAVALGIEVREADLTRQDLFEADGLFLTNALIGVWPVRRLVNAELDTRRLPRELIDQVRIAAFTPNDWGAG
jgi:4-amino-4-deoxychorismate lyase